MNDQLTLTGNLGFTRIILRNTGRSGHRITFQEKCNVCDRKIRTAKSVRAGTGPVCRHKLIRKVR
jgi:spore maturation protein CgeB